MMTEGSLTKLVDGDVVPLGDEEIAEFNQCTKNFEAARSSLELADMTAKRRAAYRNECDPLAIRAWRLGLMGDKDVAQANADYLAKVAEVKSRYPYPTL
jgi:hypothetical protein